MGMAGGAHTAWQVVYGGSFNPLHIGHVALVESLATLPEVAKIWVIPAHRSPYKPTQTMLPNTLRLRMLRAQFSKTPKVCISTFEIDKRGSSYSVDTLLWLRATLEKEACEMTPGVPPCLALVLGWDAFMAIPGWREITTILRMVALWVVPRQGEPQNPQTKHNWFARVPLAVQTLLKDTQPQALIQALLLGQCIPKVLRYQLRLLPLKLPSISSSYVMQTRKECWVAPMARPFLQAYWQAQTPTK